MAKIKHAVFYRLTRKVGLDNRGDYFLDVGALNFIDAIDKVVKLYDSDPLAVRIEMVYIKPSDFSKYVVFDSENLVC